MSKLPNGYALIDEQSLMDAGAAHAFLSRSYWAKGIPLEIVERSIEGSLCVAVSFEGEQIAFARVVSDYATFAYLADVYVLENHRAKGISKAMIAHLHDHPKLQDLRRWILFTLDAHSIYKQMGWKEVAHPERGMERVLLDSYK